MSFGLGLPRWDICKRSHGRKHQAAILVVQGRASAAGRELFAFGGFNGTNSLLRQVYDSVPL
jgi:hypothetical protein